MPNLFSSKLSWSFAESNVCSFQIVTPSRSGNVGVIVLTSVWANVRTILWGQDQPTKTSIIGPNQKAAPLPLRGYRGAMKAKSKTVKKC